LKKTVESPFAPTQKGIDENSQPHHYTSIEPDFFQERERDFEVKISENASHFPGFGAL